LNGDHNNLFGLQVRVRVLLLLQVQVLVRVRVLLLLLQVLVQVLVQGQRLWWLMDILYMMTNPEGR
jgi:hypothetical protein